MVWGRARTLRGVHYFNEYGESLCQEQNGRHLKLRYPREFWNADHPETCPKCKLMVHDQRDRMREEIRIIIEELKIEI